MKLEISSDLLQEITAAELQRTLKSLQKDIKDRKAGKKISIFSMDKAEDIAELNRHVDAFTLVGQYYGVKI
jgi:hypothetical protein